MLHIDKSFEKCSQFSKEKNFTFLLWKLKAGMCYLMLKGCVLSATAQVLVSNSTPVHSISKYRWEEILARVWIPNPSGYSCTDEAMVRSFAVVVFKSSPSCSLQNVFVKSHPFRPKMLKFTLNSSASFLSSLLVLPLLSLNQLNFFRISTWKCQMIKLK